MAQTEPLTLDSCIALARKNNPEIATSRLDIDRAMEVKKQVFTKYFPQVQGSFMAYHSLHHILGISPGEINKNGNTELADILQAMLDGYNSLHGSDETELGLMRHGLSVGGTAVQPIFMGGRIVNGNRLAKLGVEAAELQAEVTERDIIENIESSFYLVVGLKQKTGTLQSALALLDSIDHTATVAYEAGVVTKSDLLQVALKRNEMLAKEQQLSSGIVLATKLLCHQIGIPYSPDLEFDDTQVATFAEKNETRPEVQLLGLNVRAEELRKKLTIGETLPQIVLGGTYYYGDIVTNGNLLDKSMYKHNGLIFASAIIPITGWWETSHKIREHNIRIEQAKIKQEHLGGMMTIQEEKALSDWQQAEALLKADSSALEMAEENYRLALLNYQAGLCTLNEVLQANTLLLQAQNAITDRRITLSEARRRYHDLTGK